MFTPCNIQSQGDNQEKDRCFLMIVPPKTESTLVATLYLPQIEELLSKYRSVEMAQPMVRLRRRFTAYHLAHTYE